MLKFIKIHTFLFVGIPIIGFILLTLSNPMEAAKNSKAVVDETLKLNATISITDDFQRVSIDRKNRIVIYDYTESQITFEIRERDVLLKVTKSEKLTLELKADKNNAQIKTSTSREWKTLESSFRDVDTDALALLLNKPTFSGRAFIGNTLNSREAKEIELGIINYLSMATRQGHELSGTVSGSCSCSSGSISMSCPTGCGMSCKDETRQVCDILYTESGEIASGGYEDEFFCIGRCLC